jgi:hypothetical protein
LNSTEHGGRNRGLSRPARRLLAAGLAALFLLASLPAPAQTPTESSAGLVAGDGGLQGFDDLPPGERYRQFLFLLFITEGFDQELLATLPADPTAENTVRELETRSRDVPNAGLRIAGPETLVAGTANLARFRLAAEPAIRAELDALARAYPTLMQMVDEAALAEEALLYRAAFLDSAEPLLAGQGDVPVTLDAYRQQTVRLRNDVEFRAFEAQVDEVTEWVGSESAAQLEAFHRMVDENADAEFIRERAGAAEAMNEAAREEQRQWATRRTFQLLWLLGPIMSRAFR